MKSFPQIAPIAADFEGDLLGPRKVDSATTPAFAESFGATSRRMTKKGAFF